MSGDQDDPVRWANLVINALPTHHGSGFACQSHFVSEGSDTGYPCEFSEGHEGPHAFAIVWTEKEGRRDWPPAPEEQAAMEAPDLVTAGGTK